MNQRNFDIHRRVKTNANRKFSNQVNQFRDLVDRRRPLINKMKEQYYLRNPIYIHDEAGLD